MNRLLIIGIVFVTLLEALVWRLVFNPFPEVSQSNVDPEISYLPPSTTSFVGSQACAECHQELVALFKNHPMAHSITTSDFRTDAHVPENGQVEIPGKHRLYEVEFQQGTMGHRKKMLDVQDEAIYDQAFPISFVVSSGRWGQAYVHRRGSRLFQSPLNWYSETSKWDFAPGYRPDDDRRFDRLGTANISHVTQTDHRVLRSPQRDGGVPDSEQQETSLYFFDEMHRRLEPWERDRALGLAAYLVLGKENRLDPTALYRKLNEVLLTIPKDGFVLTTLGAITLDNHRLDEAREFFERALSIPDAQEAARQRLLKVHYLSSDWERAFEHADWLVASDLGNYRAQALKADCLLHRDRLDEAVRAAELAVRYNPSVFEVRSLLGNLYRKNGLQEKQHHQEQFLNRIQEARNRE